MVNKLLRQLQNYPNNLCRSNRLYTFKTFPLLDDGTHHRKYNFGNDKFLHYKSIPSNRLEYRGLCIDQTLSVIGLRFFHIDKTLYNSVSGREGSHLPPCSSQEFAISAAQYEHVVEETLESLTSYFDQLLEEASVKDGDVQYSSGVLTLKLGKFGTYVINKQTPNRQIWLSSPTSGPKRYDFIDGTWIYKHDGVSMCKLLNSEIPKILSLPNLDFESNCLFGKSSSK